MKITTMELNGQYSWSAQLVPAKGRSKRLKQGGGQFTTTSSSAPPAGGGGDFSSGMPYTVTADGNYLVDQTILSSGDIVAFSGGNASPDSSIGILDDLSDVDTAGRVDGYVLTYTSSSGKWLAKMPTGGSGGGVVSWDDVLGKPSFAVVAASGSYVDLVNKPTIPSVPIWALQVTKPVYVADEVGALPASISYEEPDDDYKEYHAPYYTDFRNGLYSQYIGCGSLSTTTVSANTLSVRQITCNQNPLPFTGHTFLQNGNRIYAGTGNSLSNGNNVYMAALNNGVWGDHNDIVGKFATFSSAGVEGLGTLMFQGSGSANVFMGKGRLFAMCDITSTGTVKAEGDVIAYASSSISTYTERGIDTPDYVGVLIERINHLETQVQQLINQQHGSNP